jgi:uncharacterized protein (TIGR04145 family)
MVLIVPANTKQVSAFNPIVIDGYYGDWSDKPYSWEYNWDNPYIIEHYWDGTQNITKKYTDENGNPYNLEIRHKMAIYTDGEYVYLHIEISNKPGSGMNGEDYRFYIDGQMAAFRVTYSGGDNLNKNDKKIDPGIYNVEIRHRDGGISNMVVEGATAAFTKKTDDTNNEIEMKIPLSAMKLQNSNINIDTFNMLEFYCPNLMYRRIACSGVSTAPYLGIGICIVLVAGVYFVNKRFPRSKKV